MNKAIFVMCITATLAAAPAWAQDTTTAVRPGMSEADVTTRWGEPVAVRRIGDWTYLYYANGLERQAGFWDVVFLQGGQVVDAIVRAPGRTYLGQSSSPPERAPEFTPPAQPPANPRPGAAGAPAVPGAVTGIHVTP